MKRLVLIVCAIVICSPTAVFAQQAGDNINVLPVVLPVDINPADGIPDDPDWYLKGDGYLQRQLEPSIAASTRNPDHLLAFFNDYRAVDIADDTGLGETQNVAMVFNSLRTMMAGMLPWSALPEIPTLPQVAAYSEAWVGMSRSYDGGLTWSGGFLPGGPFDNSLASLGSPVYGLEAATDPVVAAGPCGTFYVVFVAFTRGDQSMIAVARYQDLNNHPGGDTIVYQGTTVLETGNNAEYGYFLDKPDLEVDIMRPQGPDQCGHRVYVSYSTFNGLSQDLKFQSKINFSSSSDGGQTFTKAKINQPFSQNQGSAIAIDPRPGTPKTGGGGTVYLFWRHFFDPDTIVMTKTLDYGKKWSKANAIIGPTPMAPFDQPTISTTTAISNNWTTVVNTGFPETGFRSNGFPTASVTVNEVAGEDEATVFVAWQERVGGTGLPLANGSPRIVLMRSDDAGDTWSDFGGTADQRKAVDIGWRDLANDTSTPAPGSGLLPQERPSGPQVMPKLSFGGGRLMLSYYESRGRIANYGTLNEEILTSQVNPDADIASVTGFITGYDRLLDFRAALLDPMLGNRLSSIQVSRYPLSAGADLATETLEDVAPINPPCAPDHNLLYPGETLNPCVRQVNRAGAPQSAAGTSPFMGDYPGMEPFVQFVTDANGNWRWATKPGDVPTRGFHTVWADNRHLVPPQNPIPGTPWIEWQHYPDYDQPGSGDVSCANPGSRNTDVLTSRIDAELIINSPTTFKQIGVEGASFPFTIGNQTDQMRSYNLTITPVVGDASFLSRTTVTEIDVDIFPFSSTAQVVYVPTPTIDPITVQVTETDCPAECQTGSITFNAHETMASDQTVSSEFFNPGIEPDAFVINYSLDNAFVINPGAENAFVINPSVDNAFVINPTAENAFVINAFVINAFVINAFVINSSLGGEKAEGDPEYYDVHNVIDTTWTVTPGESTDAASFLPIINIDNAENLLENYVFQLIVHKGSLYGTLDGCEPANVNQPQILSTFAQGPNDLETQSAFVINPTPENAFVINTPEFPGNAFVINSTFTVAPADDEPAGGAKAVTVTNDDTLKAPRAPETVNVTLRAYQIKSSIAMDNDGDDYYNPFPAGHPNNPETRAGDPASLTVAAHNCDPTEPAETCFAFNAPDLVPIAVSQLAPLEVQAGDAITFPNGGWTLENQGNTAANAENRHLRHGFFLSKSPIVELDEDDLPIGSDVVRLGYVNSTFDTLQPGDTEDFLPGDAVDLIIPADWPIGGDDYIVVFVDDFKEVSEVFEDNNTFAIPITVLEPNDPPAAIDTPVTTDEDTVFTGLLSADDPDGDELKFTILTDPSNGAVTLDDATTGAFTYTPNENFNGSDSFTFEVSDGEFSSEIATAWITITAVNDAPEVEPVVLEVAEDKSVDGALIVTDPDDDTFSFALNPAPSNGTVTFSETVEGGFTYEPTENYFGDDNFAITVTDSAGATGDAAVTITVTAVNDTPEASNDAVTTPEDTPVPVPLAGTDIDGDLLTFSVVDAPTSGSLSGTPPNLTYSPNANFHGSDSFTFKANDGQVDSNTAVVSITITAVNDLPAAMNDTVTIPNNSGPNVIDVLANDTDIDNVALYVTAVGAAVNGTTAIGEAGAFVTYNPNDNFLGDDSFTYQIADGSGGTSTATVTVTVFDLVADWNFVGLLTPWKPNYSANAGSAIPLKWYYTDPATGVTVDSSVAEPVIRIKGPFVCNVGEDEDTVEFVNDPGSSDLRYISDEWQFNWDTVGLEEDCYNIRIYHPYTDQIDGPFRIRLK